MFSKEEEKEEGEDEEKENKGCEKIAHIEELDENTEHEVDQQSAAHRKPPNSIEAFLRLCRCFKDHHYRIESKNKKKIQCGKMDLLPCCYARIIDGWKCEILKLIKYILFAVVGGCWWLFVCGM